MSELSTASLAVGPSESVASHFRRVVAEHPDRIAVRGQDTSYTFEALDRESSRIANFLVNRLGPVSEPVALLMPYGARAVAVVMGILKAGKFYVPLDPAFPDARNQAILADVEPKLLLTCASTIGAGRRLSGPRPVVDIDELPPNVPDTDPCLDIHETAYAYVLYTSGSTGTPRGVIGSHRCLLRICRIRRVRLGHAARTLALAPLTFAASTSEIFVPLLAGATLCPFDVRANGTGAGLADWIDGLRITVCGMVPSVFRNLATYLVDSGRRLETLRSLGLTGDRVLWSDFELYQKCCGDGCVFEVHYGSSEVRLIAGLLLRKSTPVEQNFPPIGYPNPDIEVLLLGEDGRSVPVGSVGEIVVRTTFASPGYWRRPDLDTARFEKDGDHTIYRTGDLGRRDADGCLHCLGRTDNQVKIRGSRVDLDEIETVINGLDGVRTTVVVVQEVSEGSKQLIAYYIPDRALPRPASSLRAELRVLLPDYMVPTAYVPLDSFPVNAHGKLDRSALPAPSRREHRI
jgi:amino acid adenylation domain-containing protein